jgi:LPXTG-motif cell wall-anchored protein
MPENNISNLVTIVGATGIAITSGIIVLVKRRRNIN